MNTMIPDITIQKAQRAFERAESYDISLILQRYVKDFEASDEKVKSHELELKRFLTLCAHSELPYGMVEGLDDLWHTFIIFTRKYSDFCVSCFGNYVHHTPYTEGDQQRRNEPALYLQFFSHYKSVFGELPARSVWPYPSEILLKQHDLSHFSKLFENVTSSNNDLDSTPMRPSGVCGHSCYPCTK